MTNPTYHTPARNTRHWVGRTAATLALVWAALVLLTNIAGGYLACRGDSSSCVSTRHKTMVYRGNLPFANTPFKVDFPSVSQAGGGLVGGFRTNSDGRYCILWAPEGGTFVISGREKYGYFDIGQTLHGPPPAGCQSGNKNVPWWRASDLTSSPQYLTIIGVALLAMTVLVIGLFIRRLKVGMRVRETGLALALASTVVALVLWWGAISH